MTVLLSVAELKGYIQDTAESDATLEQRITDTEAELDARFGRLGAIGSGDDGLPTVTERVWIRTLYQTRLGLGADVDEITELKMTDFQAAETTLEAATYLLQNRDVILAAGGAWAGRYYDVTYRPADTRATRRRGLIKLIQLDMNFQPGMGGQSGGPWAEQYAGRTYDEIREEIMATIGEPELFA